MSMMYVFICPKCGRSTMVSLYRSLKCRVCQADMANCEIDFLDWVELEPEQRQKLIGIYQKANPSDLCFYRPMPYYDHKERNYW